MKGQIRWMQVNPETNEFLYDLGTEELDTSKKSVRDTVVELLCDKWENFGLQGDCILISKGEE